MSTVTEQSIQIKIMAFLKSRGIFHYKNILTNVAGIPDITAIEPKTGRFIGIEVKRQKGRLSPLQERNIEMIQRSGGRAIVAYCVDDVKRYFE